MTLAQLERRMLWFRMATVVGIAGAAWFFLPNREQATPISSVLLTVSLYAAYWLFVVFGLLPRASSKRVLYVLAIVDASVLLGAIFAVLFMAGMSSTPLIAAAVLSASYYSAMYGLVPGLLTAGMLAVGCTLMYIHPETPVARPLSAFANWVPLILLVSLVGIAARRWGPGRDARALAPVPADAPVAVQPPPVAATAPTPSPAEVEAMAVGAAPASAVAVAATPAAQPPSIAEPVAPAPASLDEPLAGALRVNRLAGKVFLNGQEVSLSPTEVQLLEFLARQPGAPVSQEHVLQSVWGDAYTGQMNVVNVTVHRLRRKLERYGYGELILTVRGKGYVLDPSLLKPG